MGQGVCVDLGRPRRDLIAYATSDWTSTAGSDYTGVAGSLTFEPGETSKSVTVQIHGDDLHERDELFYFDVSATFNASHQEDTALGIIDDDDMPWFSVSDASVVEGDSGTVQLIFTVSLSNPSEVLAGVQYATAGGTATAGVDYQSNSGTLVFDPSETSKTVAVEVIGDLVDELDETLN